MSIFGFSFTEHSDLAEPYKGISKNPYTKHSKRAIIEV